MTRVTHESALPHNRETSDCDAAQEMTGCTDVHVRTVLKCGET